MLLRQRRCLRKGGGGRSSCPRAGHGIPQTAVHVTSSESSGLFEPPPNTQQITAQSPWTAVLKSLALHEVEAGRRGSGARGSRMGPILHPELADTHVRGSALIPRSPICCQTCSRPVRLRLCVIDICATAFQRQTPLGRFDCTGNCIRERGSEQAVQARLDKQVMLSRKAARGSFGG